MASLYYSYSSYLKNRFGKRVRKIPLHTGFGCPNIDGTLSHTGCIYCNMKSFSYNYDSRHLSVKEQIISFLANKDRHKDIGYLAYLQSGTNTYTTPENLKVILEDILSFDEIIGIVISTRPDFLPKPILDLLKLFKEKTYIAMELGLQSSHNETLLMINRNHSVDDFVSGYKKLKTIGIEFICVHVILGLPGEDVNKMIETAHFLNELGVDCVKIHHLYIPKNTIIEKMYKNDSIRVYNNVEDYIEDLSRFIANLNPNIVVQRLFSDCFDDMLIAPRWNINKAELINKIRSYLLKNNIYQGSALK